MPRCVAFWTRTVLEPRGRCAICPRSAHVVSTRRRGSQPRSSFVVPFKGKQALRESAYAHQGRYGGRAYTPKVLKAHVDELQQMSNDVCFGLRRFLFWGYPYLSSVCFMLWQANARVGKNVVQASPPSA